MICKDDRTEHQLPTVVTVAQLSIKSLLPKVSFDTIEKYQ